MRLPWREKEPDLAHTKPVQRCHARSSSVDCRSLLKKSICFLLFVPRIATTIVKIKDVILAFRLMSAYSRIFYCFELEVDLHFVCKHRIVYLLISLSLCFIQLHPANFFA